MNQVSGFQFLSNGIRDKLDNLKRTFELKGNAGVKELNKSSSWSNVSVSSANDRNFIDFETRSDVKSEGVQRSRLRTISNSIQSSFKDEFRGPVRSLTDTLPMNKLMELHEAILDASDKEFDRLTKR